MDALLRRRAMIAAGAIPAGLPYIRGGADGSYIDTGITADNTVKVIIWARNFNPTTGFIFGSRITTNNNAFALGSHTGANTNRFRFDFGTTINYVDGSSANMYGYHKYTLDGNKCYVDDVLIATSSESTFTNSYNIFLYGLNNAGTLNGCKLPLDVCACKIYKNGTLVRDYTAVKSPSAGLYDAVSETLFTNAGSGSFTYGTFNPVAYMPLEYVSCSGSQYFDSGVKGTAAVPIVSKFRIVGTNKGGPSLFGTYSSGTASSYFFLQFGNDSNKNSRANFYINSTTALQLYNNTSIPLTSKDLTVVKTDTSITLYENNAVIGAQKTFSVSSSWETPYTFAVGTSRHLGGFASGISFEGRIYYFGIGAYRNFVPGKRGDKVGMYDTYNDVFVESATSTPFTAGPEL